MVGKIGVVVADQKEFIQFCKEYGLSLGSSLVKNLFHLGSVHGEVFSCVYITANAKLKRNREDILDIISYVQKHCQSVNFVYD